MTEPIKKDVLDFIVIGAAKAGTTTLFEHLRQHPEIDIPPAKETPFFSNDAAVAHGWRWYLERHFAFAEGANAWGTVTPQYMFGGMVGRSGQPSCASHEDHAVPSRIYNQLPHVRLIAILRDPIERARSEHRMYRALGTESRSFEEAIDALLDSAALSHSRRHSADGTCRYIIGGEYGRILSPYFEIFPRDQILVVFTPELNDDPLSTMQRIYGFIGVATDFVPANIEARYYVGTDRQQVAWVDPQAIHDRLARVGPARLAWSVVPSRSKLRILTQWDRMAYSVNAWNRRAGPRSAPDAPSAPSTAPSTIRRLRHHYAPDGNLLESLVDRALPWTERER